MCTIDDTKLIIGGDGRFDGCGLDYRDMQKITEIEFGDGVTTIGDGALEDINNLKVLNTNMVTTIEREAIDQAHKLSTLIMPHVTSIGNYAFEEAYNLESIYMPKIESFGVYVFPQSNNIKYIEMQSTYIDNNGDEQTVTILDGTFEGDVKDIRPACYNNNGYIICGKCNGYLQTGSGCVKNCNPGYLDKEGRCISASNGCGKNYRQIGTWCNRIRYTPAEAAKVLKDDNTNVVTITFKM